jgi:hypothetical protein
MLFGVPISDLTRYVGVSVTIIGAFAAAPSSPAVWAAQARRRLAALSGRLRAFLGRWFPGMAKKTSVTHSVSATSNLESAFLRASGQVRPGADASVERQLEMMWKELTEIWSDVARVEIALSQRSSDLSARMASVNGELRQSISELRDLASASHQSNSEIAAWAFGPIIIGVILTGIPEFFASWPLGLWVVGMAGALVGSGAMAVRAHATTA